MFSFSRIRSKILIIPIVASVGFAGLWASGHYFGAKNAGLLRDIEEGYVPALSLSRDLEESLQGIQSGFQEAVGTEDVDILEEVDELRDAFSAIVVRSTQNPIRDKAVADKIAATFDDYYKLARATSADLAENGMGEDVSALEEMVKKYNAVHSILRKTTQVDREAMTRAFIEANAALEMASGIALLGAILALLTLLAISAKLISNITTPLNRLTKAAGKLAAGDREAQVQIDTGDELQVLGDSFNSMVAQLKESYSQLEDMNQNLEQKVEERTVELARRNDDMRLVLDNVKEGFVTVFADGTMSSEASAILTSWFGAPEGDDITFAHHVGKADSTFGLGFEIGWDQLFDDFMPEQVSLDMLPVRLHVQDLTFSVDYLPVRKGEKLTGCVVHVTDISPNLARERMEAEQAETVSLFQAIARDVDGFRGFFRESDRLAEEICDAGKLESGYLKRAVHTLKGNAGLYGLGSVSSLCHAIETTMVEDGLQPEGEEKTQLMQPLRERWTAISALVGEMLGDQDGAYLELSEKQYWNLLACAKNNDAQGHVLEALIEYGLEPVRAPLERLAHKAEALGRRLGRGAIKTTIITDDSRLDAEAWLPFWSSLAHMVRNAIDHGFREENPSRPQQLTFGARLEGEQFIIELGDNGAGIDWPKVREKAAAQGLPADSHEELVEALFAEGVSTAAEVSETSGRGVGMGAVMMACRHGGGNIKVDSELGKGTNWIFEFPASAMSSVYHQRTLEHLELLLNGEDVAA